jgi:putative methionine-R-sulfoxide reductase with GAF domain
MPPRTLASLAHALSVAPDLDASLVALGEALAELDRQAVVGILRYDARRELFDECRVYADGGVVTRRVDTTFDHLPPTMQPAVRSGVQFADFGDKSADYARLFGLPPIADGGLLSMRGLLVSGQLAAVCAVYESRRIFGARTAERFAPSVALFELAFARIVERDGREEAGRTLEAVMQRVHAEYDRRLAAFSAETTRATGEQRTVLREREIAQLEEDLRQARQKGERLERQVEAAVGQLEQAHVELHRRSEGLRQRTRTLYLLDRMLTVDATTEDPRRLAEGLLNLAGEDMQAQRCSLMLVEPGTEVLYLAAVRGVAPNVALGERLPIGRGVAGRVAASREPLLVQDVDDAAAHPLLQDQFFTSGSFISCPLVYRDELVGVLNLSNRARFGVFVEDDVERVRLLALVTSLICVNSRLNERLLETLGVR